MHQHFCACTKQYFSGTAEIHSQGTPHSCPIFWPRFDHTGTEDLSGHGSDHVVPGISLHHSRPTVRVDLCIVNTNLPASSRMVLPSLAGTLSHSTASACIPRRDRKIPGGHRPSASLTSTTTTTTRRHSDRVASARPPRRYPRNLVHLVLCHAASPTRLPLVSAR